MAEHNDENAKKKNDRTWKEFGSKKVSQTTQAMRKGADYVAKGVGQVGKKLYDTGAGAAAQVGKHAQKGKDAASAAWSKSKAVVGGAGSLAKGAATQVHRAGKAVLSAGAQGLSFMRRGETVDQGAVDKFYKVWNNTAYPNAGNVVSEAYNQFLNLNSVTRKNLLTVLVPEIFSLLEKPEIMNNYDFSKKTEEQIIADFTSSFTELLNSQEYSQEDRKQLTDWAGFPLEAFQKLTQKQKKQVLQRGIMLSVMGTALLVYCVPFLYGNAVHAWQSLPSMLASAKAQVGTLLASPAVTSLKASVSSTVVGALTAAQTKLSEAASYAAKATLSAETLTAISNAITSAQTSVTTALTAMYQAIPRERMGTGLASLSATMAKLPSALSNAQACVTTMATSLLSTASNSQMAKAVSDISSYMMKHVVKGASQLGIKADQVPGLAKLIAKTIVGMGTALSVVNYWRQFSALSQTEKQLSSLLKKRQ